MGTAHEGALAFFSRMWGGWLCGEPQPPPVLKGLMPPNVEFSLPERVMGAI